MSTNNRGDNAHDDRDTRPSPGQADPSSSARRRLSRLLRVEDLVIGAWVAIASPLLLRASGEKGPFDPGQPLEGTLRLVAVFGVLACIAIRPPASVEGQPSILSRASVGPFTGGVLLVTISGFVALETPSAGVLALIAGTAIALILVHFVAPPAPIAVRRALVSPFAVVSAGLYWSVIEAVVAGGDFSLSRQNAIADRSTALLALGFLIAFSSVYYAMLIYAPRQVAEREGGLLEWAIRYSAFVVSVVLGIGWLSALST